MVDCLWEEVAVVAIGEAVEAVEAFEYVYLQSSGGSVVIPQPQPAALLQPQPSQMES